MYKGIRESSKISKIPIGTLQRWRVSGKIKCTFDVEKQVFLYDMDSIIKCVDRKNKLCRCGIYAIRNIQNNKRCVGSSKNIRKRWNKHKSQLNNNNHDNSHLQRAWNKYGIDSFVIDVVEECVEDKLAKREGYFIEKYETFDRNKGYNIQRFIQRPVMSEETKLKIGMAQKGKIVSKETRQKMSLSATKRKVSEATKIKIRLWHTGRNLSESHKKNIGKAISGENNGMYGKTHSAESIEKIIAKRRKAVIQKDMHGKIVNKYISVREAERQTGIHQSQISRCCLGRCKSAKGYIWEYI